MSTRGDQESSEPEEAERRLEALAEEMERVISGCRPEERDALHGYAVSLVRDRLPAVEVGESTEPAQVGADDDGTRRERGGGPASLIGYGVLLLLVGSPLLIVFPFVGVLLFVGGAAMSGLGLMLFLVWRPRPERTAGGSK